MGRFERAAGMYENWIVKFSKAPEATKEDLLQVSFRLSECYIKAKQYDKAIEYLEKLLLEENWEWDARRMLITVYHAKGLTLENEAQREAFGKAIDIINKEIIPQVKPHGPDWFYFKKKLIEIYLDMGEYRSGIARIEMIDDDYFWGTQKMREEIADMLEKYAEKLDEEDLKPRWNTTIEKLKKIVEIPEEAEAVPEEPEEAEAVPEEPEEAEAVPEEPEEAEAVPEELEEAEAVPEKPANVEE
jgi:tetratricopeptide (TPR) repeat protein